MSFQPWATTAYDVSHFAMSCEYLVLLGFAFHWRLRKEEKNKDFYQRVFAIFLVLGTLSRSFSFALIPFLTEGFLQIDPKISLYLNLIPGFFVLTDYIIILFLWAEIYHSYYDKTANGRPYFYVVISTMTVIMLSLCIADLVKSPPMHSNLPLPVNLIQVSMFLFIGGMYILTAIVYAIYGGRFYWMFSRGPPLLQKTRTTIFPKVKIVTILCAVIFICRGILTIWNSIQIWPANFWWWVDPLYYSVLEVLPLVLIIILLESGDDNASPSNVPSRGQGERKAPPV